MMVPIGQVEAAEGTRTPDNGSATAISRILTTSAMPDSGGGN